MRIIKIGLYGGTFNPIHNGHLMIAEYMRDFLNLNKVIFIPSKIPPHKTEFLDSNYRVDMVKLATCTNDSFIVSMCEIERDCESLTYDTLKSFNDLYKTDKEDDLTFELFLIIGIDAFLEVPEWDGWNDGDLLGLCNWSVVNRNITEDKSKIQLRKDYNNLIYSLPPHIISKTKSIILHSVPGIDISSSLIRDRIKEGRSIKYLVPHGVIDYIEKHNLYK